MIIVSDIKEEDIIEITKDAFEALKIGVDNVYVGYRLNNLINTIEQEKRQLRDKFKRKGINIENQPDVDVWLRDNVKDAEYKNTIEGLEIICKEDVNDETGARGVKYFSDLNYIKKMLLKNEVAMKNNFMRLEIKKEKNIAYYPDVVKMCKIHKKVNRLFSDKPILVNYKGMNLWESLRVLDLTDVIIEADKIKRRIDETLYMMVTGKDKYLKKDVEVFIGNFYKVLKLERYTNEDIEMIRKYIENNSSYWDKFIREGINVYDLAMKNVQNWLLLVVSVASSMDRTKVHYINSQNTSILISSELGKKEISDALSIYAEIGGEIHILKANLEYYI